VHICGMSDSMATPVHRSTGTENGMLPGNRLPYGEKILPECTKQNAYWIGAMSGPYLENIAAVIRASASVECQRAGLQMVLG
jgi:hypothetical protein